MRRYLTHLLASTALALTVTTAFNWFADPYAVFGGPRLPNINEAKPAVADNTRIFKMVGYLHRPMAGLILGTSRAHVGLNPKHQAFGGLKTVNLAMAAQPNAETALLFKYVAEHNPLQMAVIGLDFFASNAYLIFTQDFTPDNFEKDRKWKLLLSFDTLTASGKTLFKEGSFPKGPDEAITETRKKYSKQALLNSEKGYMWGGTYLPAPKCRFRFEAEPSETGNVQRTPPLEEVRAMIALAHRRHVKLYLFISPSHARQWEVLAVLGLWEAWEDWKRQLVRINEEEAAQAHRQPFPLWDFSGYHSISTENLPDSNASDAEMAGYIESSHYKPNIGNLVLDRMFDLKVPDRTLPDDFGILLTHRNIEPHLQNIRAARAVYRHTHPSDLIEIANLEKEVKQQNRCIDYSHAAPEPVKASGTGHRATRLSSTSSASQ
jgi:hypothetical protein